MAVWAARAHDGAENPTTFRNSPVGAASADNQLPGNTYDGDGAPTTYNGSALTYDPEGRLASFGSVTSSAYTGDGLRGVKTFPAASVYFLYDGDQSALLLKPWVPSVGLVTGFPAASAANSASVSTATPSACTLSA